MLVYIVTLIDFSTQENIVLVVIYIKNLVTNGRIDIMEKFTVFH